MKATAQAAPNIALIKYWGRDENNSSDLNIPSTDSISMTKQTIPNSSSVFNLITTTTVEFLSDYKADIGFLIEKGKKIPFNEFQMNRIKKVVDPLRKLAGINLRFKMVSKNQFPTEAGLASSASAFAALVTSAAKSLRLELTKQELSSFARLGSGSATRSIYGGFAHWHKGRSHETSFAEQICSADQIDINAVIAVVDSSIKKIGSSQGHTLASTSALNKSRIFKTKEHVEQLKKALLDDDFTKIGMIMEESCLLMHSVMMTSQPHLFYWDPLTLKIIHTIIDSRMNQGIESYFTIDAGPNIHCFCRPEDLDEIKQKFIKIGIKENNLILVKPAEQGTKIVNKDLF